MALVDPTTDQLVIRVVYDGPAYAGKTTTVRALARSLGGEVFSAAEADGRTLYFDWVDYLGGRFEGMPIRCQIVAVPGQQVLVQRRRLLLETADVVVFVVDSRRSALAETRRAFDELCGIIARTAPPFAVVAQANKRDLPEVMDLDALRSALGKGRPLAMTETVAETGDGVRETFVLAVRLALDRVREMWSNRSLPRLQPEVASGAELLATMQAVEEGVAASLATIGFGAGERRLAEDAAGAAAGGKAADGATAAGATPAGTGAPAAPDAGVPPGMIWPPVEGRIMVHEAMRVPPAIERRGPQGDWLGVSRDWQLRSPRGAVFHDLEEARRALIGWARWHTAAAARLSPQRCVMLVPTAELVVGGDEGDETDAGGRAPEAPEGWRLWQIVRRVPSLADDCREMVAHADDASLGEGLLRIAEVRLRAERELRGGGWLRRLDLRSVGAGVDGRPVFTRFAPYPAEIPPWVEAADDATGSLPGGSPDLDAGAAGLLRAELGPLLRRELALVPRRLPAVLAGLRGAAPRFGAGGAPLADLLQGLLLDA
jgi:signal recognition particle receptor subunit beta